MEEIFCRLTKAEIMRIVDLIEMMYSIFWTKAPNFSPNQIQIFLGNKNLINSILLKGTSEERGRIT